MSTIFDRYGLKEVSNVTVYALEDDTLNNIHAGDVALYLDSLKVSTIEQTAESTDATGGWGNPKLISWDYGKEMTLTLEDALLSPEFLRLMVGGAIKEADGDEVTVPVNFTSRLLTIATADTLPTVYDTYDKKHTSPTTYRVVNMTTGVRSSVHPAGEGGTPAAETLTAAVGDKIRIFWVEDVEKEDKNQAVEITISPSTFPGTYKFVGDTVIRSETTGADEPFQWVVPKAKISSEVSFTMEAEGDPATFEMTVNVLRSTNEDGQYEMMKFIKYNVESVE